MSGQIFISYRREDASHAAGRLYDQLAQKFPKTRIFMDIDNLDPGEDFAEEIKKSVGSCDILIALIGRQWLDAHDPDGNRRLDNPDDWVRLEVSHALKRGIRVIPVLLDGAMMPRSTQLPDDLQPMVQRQAVEVSHSRFATDSQRIVSAINRAFEKAAIKQRDREEKERLEAEQRQREEKEQLEAGQREKERLEAQQREKERLEAEQREKERLEAEQREKERLGAEQRRRERLADEQRKKERLEAERLEAEQHERERLAAEQREKKPPISAPARRIGKCTNYSGCKLAYRGGARDDGKADRQMALRGTRYAASNHHCPGGPPHAPSG